MTKAINNYDKTKISMAHVFLQYDQATMIHKYSLDHNSDWLYITFINRTYRINRKTGSVQWSDNDFEIVHEANHNEAMTIYDVLRPFLLPYTACLMEWLRSLSRFRRRSVLLAGSLSGISADSVCRSALQRNRTLQ